MKKTTAANHLPNAASVQRNVAEERELPSEQITAAAGGRDRPDSPRPPASVTLLPIPAQPEQPPHGRELLH
ncbi:hypothetical protein AAur_pTC10165 (plasmid) [Paenarthrobacter aurescens TC1]|uniref:Uncharacterized protein n=2 Tax=Paenarthrobacter aurescens TaxID=43663 RepID=Q6SK74_PAEAU|nr:hypothetical protein [Paenarthrobacter aurescens]ABM10563.1 hypothetical protein AAur_pTC10165 [Paenarthrobacter aurescens TC1]